MRLYFVEIGGKRVDWAGTQADAKAAAKAVQEQHAGELVQWHLEDLPTDKPGLIAWLKQHAVQSFTPAGADEMVREYPPGEQ